MPAVTAKKRTTLGWPGHHHHHKKRARVTPEESTRNLERHPRHDDKPRPLIDDLYRESQRVAAEIAASADETERLRRAKLDVKEGRVRWEESEDDER